MAEAPYPLTTSESDSTSRPPFKWHDAVTSVAFAGGIVVFFASLIAFAVVTQEHDRAMAKTAEATHNVATISRISIEAYERGRTEALVGPALCKSALHPVPESLDAVRHNVYTPYPTDYREGEPDQGWRCLHFDADGVPQFYQYDYTSTGPQGRFTATARGDLDGDDVTSEFAQDGAVDRTQQRAVLAQSLRRLRPDE